MTFGVLSSWADVDRPIHFLIDQFLDVGHVGMDVIWDEETVCTEAIVEGLMAYGHQLIELSAGDKQPVFQRRGIWGVQSGAHSH